MVGTHTGVPAGAMNFDMLVNHLQKVDTGIPLFKDLGGRAFSNPQFAKRTRQFAKGLQDLGHEPGARVAILSLNSAEYVEAMIGTMIAGMISVPLNIRWSAEEMLYAIGHSSMEAIVYDDTFSPMVAAIKERADSLKHFIHVGEKEQPEGTKAYADCLSVPIALELGRDVETECFMSYTGGTTGFPKGVVHTHSSMLASANIVAANGVPYHDRPALLVMPLFHLSGYGLLLARLIQNKPSLIVPMFRPDIVVAAVKNFDVSSFLMAPAMFQMLMHAPEFNSEDFLRVSQLYYGASPISEALLKLIQEKFPKTDLMQVYGMTEAGAATFLARQFHEGELMRFGAAGQAASPLIQLRIEDEDGNELPSNTIGEVVLYSPAVMKRYYNAPDQTAAVLRNGGYRTGDVGMVDDMGILSLKDRLKDMIITGAENVYTAEVESAISTHPDVSMVAVIGIPDETYGEAVHAVIVPKEGKTPTFEEIRAHTKERIAGYKCPRSMSLVEELPLSAMNKVLKNKLREPFWEDQNREIA
ncbi:Long-chain-fatty-acid--CoA ligase FadD13 [Pseudovibrio sp. W64]|uniref:AMP-binding protein n=1 Tax=Pseudovibrio sp. W64 TaxID=1735583 RepID=UPI0007AE9F1A|nr:AMP-binding protein [Pseudovibrio sp. W64]KZK87685.1 Long-chain-fatty-acid--CoA ligase FadD13 [Pseudovibrio sp. W64]